MSQLEGHPRFKTLTSVTEGEHLEDGDQGSGKNESRRVFGKLHVVQQRINRTPLEKETNEDRAKESQGLMRFCSGFVGSKFDPERCCLPGLSPGGQLVHGLLVSLLRLSKMCVSQLAGHPRLMASDLINKESCGNQFPTRIQPQYTLIGLYRFFVTLPVVYGHSATY